MTQGTTATAETPDTPAVFRIAAANRDIDDVAVHIDADNSIGGAKRRNEIRGGRAKDKKNDTLGFGVMSGAIGGKLIASAGDIGLNDDVQEQAANLNRAVGLASNVITLGAFGAMTTLGVRSDIRRATQPRATAAPAANSPDAPTTRSAAAAVTSEVAEEGVEAASRGLFSRILGTAARGLKKVPIIGGVVTAGFVAYEISQHVARGDLRDAWGAAVVGGAEIAGSTLGFVAGDAARYAAREAWIAAGNDGDVWMSDIQTVVTLGRDTLNEFNNNAAAPAAFTTAPVAQHNLTLDAA